MRSKLKRLDEQFNLQTNKFKTLNSTWTPLSNKQSNTSVSCYCYLFVRGFQPMLLRISQNVYVFKIFAERVELVSHWVGVFNTISLRKAHNNILLIIKNRQFDLWSDKQRKWFLLSIMSKCRPPQLCFMEEAFDHFGVYERKDFTTRLPAQLSKRIFSLLSAKDLCRCAQVSSHWKHLSEDVSRFVF